MSAARIALSGMALLTLGPAALGAIQDDRVHALLTTPLAGQSVSVLPFTMLIQEGLEPGALPATREARLAWADSLLGDLLTERAPEVNWVLPADLRRIARRNAPMIPNPDRMGTSVLRGRNLKAIPDPLRSSLRSLVAVVGGRLALIPAAAVFQRGDSSGVSVTVVAVMADIRANEIVWRTSAPGVGDTPLDALRAALGTILPLSMVEHQ